MKDYSLEGLRQKIRKDLRSQYLGKLFSEKRKQIQQHQIESDLKKFHEIMPHLSENIEIFKDHKGLLRRIAYNEDANFMLLALTGTIHDYLVEVDLHDDDCLLILQQISQYEDIDIAQSQQFIEGVLMSNLLNKPTIILQLICNLLKNHRYQQILRDDLLAGGILNALQQLLFGCKNTDQQQFIQFLCVDFYCLSLKSHPTLSLSQTEVIINNLIPFLYKTHSMQFLIVDYFNEVNNSFNVDGQLANVLMNTFRQFMLKQYFSFEEGILNLLMFCVRSKIGLQLQFLELILGSLQGFNKKKAMKCLLIMLEGIANTSLIIDCENLLTKKLLKKVISLFEKEDNSMKEDCVYLMLFHFLHIQEEGCLSKFYQEQFSGEDTISIVQGVILCLAQCLDSQAMVLITVGLKVIMLMMHQLFGQQTNLHINLMMQDVGLFAKVQKMHDFQNQDIKQLCENILNLHLQNEEMVQ